MLQLILSKQLLPRITNISGLLLGLQDADLTITLDKNTLIQMIKHMYCKNPFHQLFLQNYLYFFELSFLFIYISSYLWPSEI